ncbi:MAG: Flp pilus assembly complex ATPase component TadA [Candidatus Sumerlaeia bacterium]|nr:Flp pilus assembly complex ATPase component TadA [Candidatus Sumerlaeia bacterium]
MKSTNLRIAQIFAEAGFLEPAGLEILLSESGKSFREVLFSEFEGVSSLRALMTAEISLPFAKTKRDRMKAELSRDLALSPAELRLVFLQRPERAVAVVRVLEEAGLVWPDTTRQMQEGIAHSGEAHIEAMLRDRVVTVETLATYLSRENPVSQRSRRRIAGHLLIHNHLVSPDRLADISAELGKGKRSPTDVLEREGGVSQSQLLKALRGGLFLPKVNLSATSLTPELLAVLPAPVQRRHLTLPFAWMDSELNVAMSDPLDLLLLDALELLTGTPFNPHFANQRDLISVLNVLLPETDGLSAPGESGTSSAVAAEIGDAMVKAAGDNAPAISEADVDTLIDNISTVELVTTIIESAFATRATDIHIEPLSQNVRVRYRIDGRLKTIMEIPHPMLLPVVSRIKVLSDLNVTERRRPQDGHFNLDLGEGSVDLRVSVIPTHLGEKVVIRVLDEATVLHGLADLGMPADEHERLRRIISRPHGQILVAGPTGSGKTTTLYACLSTMNAEETNIVTIEDPVEYRLDGINQIQVDPKIELTFAAGLRATLRQDPDVIMVGEIRDQETAKIAVRSALTGHMVLSTLHANSSQGVVSALRHMGIPSFSIANSLAGIISQRLARKLCPACREAFEPEPPTRRDLGLDDSVTSLWRAKGCDRCLDTGYLGRVGVFEVWEVTLRLRDVILREGSERDLWKAAHADKMKTLLENAIDLMVAGTTSPDEVQRTVGLD